MVEIYNNIALLEKSSLRETFFIWNNVIQKNTTFVECLILTRFHNRLGQSQ